MPMAWPNENNIPDARPNFIEFLIIKAMDGPGDIAPIIQIAANWTQKKLFILTLGYLFVFINCFFKSKINSITN